MNPLRASLHHDVVQENNRPEFVGDFSNRV